MRYRNVKTGAEFESICNCSGGNWEPAKAPAAPAVAEPEKTEQKEEAETVEPDKAKPAPRRKKK